MGTVTVQEGLGAVVDNNPDAIVRLDWEMRYLYVNATVSAVSGYPREYFIGKTVSDLGNPPDLVAMWTEAVRKVFVTGKMVTLEFEYSLGGNTTVWEARDVPEFGEDGAVRSVCCIMRDVTEQRRTAAALRDMYDRFFLAMESTGLGTFEADYRVGKVTFSDIAMRQLGLQGGPKFDFEFLLTLIHPDDRERVLQVLRPQSVASHSAVTPFAFDYRGIRTDGQVRWFSVWGKLFSDEAGHPFRTLGVRLDITERKRLEATVRERDALSAALLDSASQSIIAVDAKGTIQLANKMAAHVFGYERTELMGQSLGALIPEPARMRHAQHERNFFAHWESRAMGIGLDLEAQRKDGTRFPVEVALSVIESLSGPLVVAFVSDITQRKQAEEITRKHAAEVETLAGSLLTAQEEERRRVSRELHDEICQQLAALTIHLGALAHEPLSESGARLLKDLQGRLVRASEKTRHIAHDLHPSVLEDLGLETAVRDLCKQFSEQVENVELDFKDIQFPAKVSRGVASCIYRVAQESLNNIRKHAGAKRVSVALRMQGRKIALTVRDDGCGFNQEAALGKGGLGLIGMKERARLEHGTLAIISKSGQGTRIKLELPVDMSLSGELLK
jgi:PAS domain S-box-containing protein